jgi:TolC family type I secretion outer membrane protein
MEETKSHAVFRSVSAAALTASMAVCIPSAALAQQAHEASPLTLKQAVTIALEKNPERKAALADTEAAAADVKEARSFLLPHVTFSETAMRGNDPVYVFGSKLRQQRFTAADFSLHSLNTPPPLNNYSSRFGGTWNLFDSFASWRDLHRAVFGKKAAKHQLERADQEVVFGVVNAYDGVLLARKELEMAEQATKTAQAIFDRSKARVDSGVAVESDLLNAQVRLAARRQELIRAQNNVSLARAELARAMGISSDKEMEPTEALSERALPDKSLDDLERQALESRPDWKRVQSEEAAQKQSVAIARSSFGPRVNAFADWQADNPTFVSGGGRSNWIAGIELQVDLFQGGAKRAKLQHEQATQQKVSALKDAARDAIRLEVRRAYYDFDAERQQVEVAKAAIAQAQESLRITQNRYESGVSTITDLLSAEEAVSRSQVDYWQTVYRYQTSFANLELATGALSAQSLVVMP